MYGKLCVVVIVLIRLRNTKKRNIWELIGQIHLSDSSIMETKKGDCNRKWLSLSFKTTLFSNQLHSAFVLAVVGKEPTHGRLERTLN